MSRKLAVFLEVGYAGMNTTEFIEVDDSISDDDLHDLVWDMAKDHAESYGYYPEKDMSDELEEEEEEESDDTADQYSNGIKGYYEDYIPEKHDQYTQAGDTPTFQKLY